MNAQDIRVLRMSIIIAGYLYQSDENVLPQYKEEDLMKQRGR